MVFDTFQTTCGVRHLVHCGTLSASTKAFSWHSVLAIRRRLLPFASHAIVPCAVAAYDRPSVVTGQLADVCVVHPIGIDSSGTSDVIKRVVSFFVDAILRVRSGCRYYDALLRCGREEMIVFACLVSFLL